jgi:riboflavin transporter FmnP
MQTTKSRINAKKLTTLAMLAALSVVLVWLVHFPIFPQATFLEYDPADIPVLIGTFAFGPLAGLFLAVAAAVVQGLTVSAQSGLYGILMHIISTGTYVLVSGFIYRHKKTRAGAAISLVAGAAVSAVVMCFANLLITPLFMGAPLQAVLDWLFPVILPFNLIKALANGGVVFLIYKPISRVFHKTGSMD